MADSLVGKKLDDRVCGFVRVWVSTSMVQGVSLIKRHSGVVLGKECREAGVHSLFATSRACSV